MSRSSNSVSPIGLIGKEISEMTGEQYSFIRYWIYRKAGIELGDLKRGHVQGRLGKRLRQIDVWSWVITFESSRILILWKSRKLRSIF